MEKSGSAEAEYRTSQIPYPGNLDQRSSEIYVSIVARAAWRIKMASEKEWVDRWLSPARFSTYLRAAGGDFHRALRLYDWNADVSAAVFRDIGHLEVALRNTCDRALSAGFKGDWTAGSALQILFPRHMKLDKPGGKRRDVNEPQRKMVQKARDSCTSEESPIPEHGKIVAELMFGFWTSLFESKFEKFVWVPYLHLAFPDGTDRTQLADTLRDIREVRNRIAHHENVLTGGHAANRQIASLMKMISPEAAAHTAKTSQVDSLLRRKP